MSGSYTLKPALLGKTNGWDPLLVDVFQAGERGTLQGEIGVRFATDANLAEEQQRIRDKLPGAQVNPHELDPLVFTVGHVDGIPVATIEALSRAPGVVGLASASVPDKPFAPPDVPFEGSTKEDSKAMVDFMGTRPDEVAVLNQDVRRRAPRSVV